MHYKIGLPKTAHIVIIIIIILLHTGFRAWSRNWTSCL